MRRSYEGDPAARLLCVLPTSSGKGAVVSPSYLMPDVIVCIPGITGSVLRKNGRDVWNISGSAVFNALRTLGGNLQDLKLEEDPVDVDDVDGIQATSVIRD